MSNKLNGFRKLGIVMSSELMHKYKFLYSYHVFRANYTFFLQIADWIGSWYVHKGLRDHRHIRSKNRRVHFEQSYINFVQMVAWWLLVLSNRSNFQMYSRMFFFSVVGHSANYAVVLAQLHTQGKCHGIHPFIVQLRDEESHQPLPGIKVGEIGCKLGMNSTNNGYLGFEQVRIPRTNMLMKNNKVLAVWMSTKSLFQKKIFIIIFLGRHIRKIAQQQIDLRHYDLRPCRISSRCCKLFEKSRHNRYQIQCGATPVADKTEVINYIINSKFRIKKSFVPVTPNHRS